jgi:hypothetical protein
MKAGRDHYVYVLYVRSPVGRDPEPFYVGVGKNGKRGPRRHLDEREALRHAAVCCRRRRKGVQFELTNRVDKLRER